MYMLALQYVPRRTEHRTTSLPAKSALPTGAGHNRRRIRKPCVGPTVPPRRQADKTRVPPAHPTDKPQTGPPRRRNKPLTNREPRKIGLAGGLGGVLEHWHPERLDLGHGRDVAEEMHGHD